MSNYPQLSQAPENDSEYVDAEIIYNGGDKKESDRIFGKNSNTGTNETAHGANDSGTEKIIRRIKVMSKGIGGIMLALGLIMLIAGIWLTSTVIGIIFGIPLIIAGAFLAYAGIAFCGAESISSSGKTK